MCAVVRQQSKRHRKKQQLFTYFGGLLCFAVTLQEAAAYGTASDVCRLLLKILPNQQQQRLTSNLVPSAVVPSAVVPSAAVSPLCHHMTISWPTCMPLLLLFLSLFLWQRNWQQGGLFDAGQGRRGGIKSRMKGQYTRNIKFHIHTPNVIYLPTIHHVFLGCQRSTYTLSDTPSQECRFTGQKGPQVNYFNMHDHHVSFR